MRTIIIDGDAYIYVRGELIAVVPADMALEAELDIIVRLGL